MQYSLIKFVLFFNSLYVFVLLARQVTFQDTVTPILYISYFFLFLIVVLGLKRFRFSKIEIFLFSLLVVSLFKSDFSVYKNSDIALDFLKPIVFICTIASIRSMSCEWIHDKGFESVYSLYAVTTVISVVIGLIFGSYFESTYPAYSSVYSLIGLFSLLYANRTKAFFFGIFLVLSGKRAVLLSGIAALFMNFSFKRTALMAGLGFLLAFLSFVLLEDFFLQNVLKIDFVYIESQADLLGIIRYVSGGRLDEIIDGFDYDFTVANVLFGNSLGYTYFSQGFGDEPHKNFHFTPASLFVNYGFLFSSILFYYIYKIVFSYSVKKLSQFNMNVFVMRMFSIASIYFFATEYGIFTYINFPIVLGLLSTLTVAYKVSVK